MTKTKQQQDKFEFKHANGDVFTYDNTEHEYRLNGVELPGTTTPLTLVNELSWDVNGRMSDKTGIIKNWALKLMYDTAVKLFDHREDIKEDEFIAILDEAKKAPNQRFKDAGISGTEIHEKIEELIKSWILSNNGYPYKDMQSLYPQIQNFINWALNNKVKFLYSEEPLYSKEWMNCGTVDFICEIDGKILIGDIKTNGDKRRYEWDSKKNSYDFTKPVSDIHIPALWQTACYGKMATEDGARKLIDSFDGVVVVNIKKSGEFDEKLDVRYNYNTKELVDAFDCVIRLYQFFRRQYNQN